MISRGTTPFAARVLLLLALLFIWLSSVPPVPANLGEMTGSQCDAQ